MRIPALVTFNIYILSIMTIAIISSSIGNKPSKKYKGLTGPGCYWKVKNNAGQVGYLNIGLSISKHRSKSDCRRIRFDKVPKTRWLLIKRENETLFVLGTKLAKRGKARPLLYTINTFCPEWGCKYGIAYASIANIDRTPVTFTLNSSGTNIMSKDSVWPGYEYRYLSLIDDVLYWCDSTKNNRIQCSELTTEAVTPAFKPSAERTTTN